MKTKDNPHGLKQNSKFDMFIKTISVLLFKVKFVNVQKESKNTKTSMCHFAKKQNLQLSVRYD